MSYIDYKSKEDLQDDTFKQIASVNWNCVIALNQRDPEHLVSTMYILYVTCWKKMGSFLNDEFELKLRELEKALYVKDIDDYQKSLLFDEARSLYKVLAGGLSDAGLLFRATIDASNMGAREEL